MDILFENCKLWLNINLLVRYINNKYYVTKTRVVAVVKDNNVSKQFIADLLSEQLIKPIYNNIMHIKYLNVYKIQSFY